MRTRLKDLLSENTTNRISLHRVEAVLENVASQLNQKDQDKLAEIYVELEMLAETLNKTPYTVFNHSDWKLLNLVLMGKVAEMRIVVEGISKKNKDIDLFPLAKALETILI